VNTDPVIRRTRLGPDTDALQQGSGRHAVMSKWMWLSALDSPANGKQFYSLIRFIALILSAWCGIFSADFAETFVTSM